MNLFSLALSNLRRRKSRMLFLVAGLVVGIATVVTLLSLQRALTVDAQNNLESYGANIVVSPRSDDLSLTYGGVALGGVALAPRDLSMRDVARIRSIPNRRNVAIVAPELLGVDARRRARGPAHGRQARPGVQAQEVVVDRRARPAEGLTSWSRAARSPSGWVSSWASRCRWAEGR